MGTGRGRPRYPSPDVSERDNLPAWAGRRGRYEVWFLTLSRPDGRAGYWIRYALRSPIAGPPEPRLWFARFDRDDPAGTFGVNAAANVLSFAEEGFEVRMGDGVLRSGRAAGAMAGGGHEVSWDLEFETGGPTFRILPDSVSRLAPTTPLTPNPDVRFRGTVVADGRTDHLDGAPGQQGHLVGTRHAERWAWASRTDDDGYAFQALSAQGRRGPLVTPYLTFAAVRVDGRWIRLRGTARRKDWSLGRWRIRLAGRRHRLEGEVRADPKQMVRARYLDPDDTPRWCHNSEVASSLVRLWERRPGGWREVVELASDGTTHAEWVGRTPAPGSFVEHAPV
jgi:hypothetical protein